MGPFHTPQRKNGGYSLIEMLVVLAIIGVLAIAGVATLGNRGGNSVRGTLDQLEGAIMDAHKYAVSTGKDVAIVTWGPYSATSTTPSMYMARGLTTTTTVAQTDFALAIKDVVLNPPATPSATQQSVATIFAPSLAREYMNVGIVIPGTTGWATAMQANSSGKQNPNITSVVPFSTDAGFKLAYPAAANNLFQNALNSVTISGANKRFNNSFFIQVVSTSSGGFAVAGGAMGLIVVLNNGATVYKFYNSGVNNGDGQWRRV